MKIFKNTLLTIAILASVSAFQVASASPNAPDSPAPDENLPSADAQASLGSRTMMMPSISIDSVSVSKQNFKAGEEIKGTFAVTNRSVAPLSKPSFRVLIGKDYEEFDGGTKVTETFLDASDMSILGDIKPGETKTVPFSYKIPAFISGQKLAVQIHVYTENSIILGNGNSEYISVEKNLSYISFSEVNLVLGDGKRYSLAEGPTIYKDQEPKTAALSMSLKNESNAGISFIPKIAVFNQQNRLLKFESAGKEIALNAGETKAVSIDLPTMEYAPAVYFAEVLLVDANGNQLASRIGVRYIVGGDIATIHTIVTDKKAVSVDEEFVLSLAISGKPLDVANMNELASSGSNNAAEGTAVKNGELRIELINELGQQVALYSQPFELQKDTYKDVSLTAVNAAKAMKAKVQISNAEGKIFVDKEISLNGDFEAIAASELLKQKIVKGGAIVLIVLLILVIVALMRKKKVGPGVLGLFVFVTIFVPAVANGWVYTGTYNTLPTNIYGNTVYGDPSVTIFSPYDYQTFIEGNNVTFAGSLYYISCANTAQRVTLGYTEVESGASGVLTVKQRSALGGEAVWYETATFVTSVPVGTKAGVHILRFRARNANGDLNDWTQGYIPYNVQCASGRAPGANSYCADPVQGSCGSIYGGTYTTSSLPSSGFCASGTALGGSISANSSGPTGYNWQCLGSAGGATASCYYSISSSGGSGSSGSSSSSTTTSGAAACGTRNNSAVAAGSNVSGLTSGLCAGGGLYGNPALGLESSSWRWMCVSGSSSAFCSASCVEGTLYCPATGVCSADCVDWCPDSIPGNPVGNQTERLLYNMDASGLCTAANIIEDFDLNPGLTDTSGTCKAFWELNDLTDKGTMVCSINGSPVSCVNTKGYGVQPGTAKFEVTITVASSTVTDSEELKCTQNPNVIER